VPGFTLPPKYETAMQQVTRLQAALDTLLDGIQRHSKNAFLAAAKLESIGATLQKPMTCRPSNLCHVWPCRGAFAVSWQWIFNIPLAFLRQSREPLSINKSLHRTLQLVCRSYLNWQVSDLVVFIIERLLCSIIILYLGSLQLHSCGRLSCPVQTKPPLLLSPGNTTLQ